MKERLKRFTLERLAWIWVALVSAVMGVGLSYTYKAYQREEACRVNGGVPVGGYCLKKDVLFNQTGVY